MERWLESTLVLLHDYRWVYDFKMTEIFDHSIPTEFLDAFERITLYDLDTVFHSEKLKPYFSECARLTELGEAMMSPYAIPDLKLDKKSLPRKWSWKKYNEVKYFSHFIEHFLGDTTDCYIDVGAGLGYLSRELSLKKKVIAIESEKMMEITSDENLELVKVHLSESNYKSELEKLLKKDEKRTSVIGLHSCGDLTPNTIKAFVESDLTSLALVSCCYHKMSNFPISSLYRNSIFSLYLFRLASQRSGQRFFNNDVESEVNHVFRNRNGSVQEKQKTLCILVMQSRLQRLSELYVQYDRVEYLRERNLNPTFARIIPTECTPRGEVIFATKKHI